MGFRLAARSVALSDPGGHSGIALHSTDDRRHMMAEPL